MSLTDADYSRAALILGCDQAAVRAVAAVESQGAGFLPSGKPKILFEAHIFSRLTEHAYDTSHPDISCLSWNQTLYKGGEEEFARLQSAAALNRDAALQAASWGAFQLMGFNWKRCGFTALQDFVNAMYKDEAAHLTAFCYFVKSMGLDDELRRLDFSGFASGFNGPAFKENRYDMKIEANYQHFKSAETLT